MSHYTLGVFTRKKITKDGELAALMAPFWEGDGDEALARMSGYFVFCDRTEEYRHAYETESIHMYQDQEGNFHNVYAPRDSESLKDERIREYRIKDLYGTFEEYMEEEGISSNQNGRYGYWYNPNARYDYFAIGGRWDKWLLTKEGKNVSSCAVSEIDFEGMKKKILRELPGLQEYLRSGFMKEDRYPDEDDYQNLLSTFHTYAVLTPDGIWLEEGTVGNFGFSSESEEERREWIQGYHNWLEEFHDCYLTILDCHI